MARRPRPARYTTALTPAAALALAVLLLAGLASADKRLQPDKHCGTDSDTCRVVITFTPPFNNRASADCFWTRLEVDFPKYTTWTLDRSMVNLTSPLNQSCEVSALSLSGNQVFELKPPTLDCFRAEGCFCDAITSAADRAINWRPVDSLLARGVTRRVCRDTRTYIYVRLKCQLDSRKGPATATVGLSWRRSGRESGRFAGTIGSQTVRDYCRQDTLISPAASNRAFLILLVALSFFPAMSALLYALARCAKRRLFGDKALQWREPAIGHSAVHTTLPTAAAAAPAPLPVPQSNASAGAATTGGPTTGGPRHHAAAAAVATASAHFTWLRQVLPEVLRVDFYDGRDRAFTALLVAAVGLYIAGTLFEAPLQPQGAYDRAPAPSLRDLTLAFTRPFHDAGFNTFGRQFGGLIITILLSSSLGALVFGALLFNMSARPWLPARRAARIYHAKLAISIASMVVLDIAALLHLSASYSLAPRWTQPLAYHLLAVVTLLVFLAANVLFVRLVVVQRRLQPPSAGHPCRDLADIRKDLHLAKALRQLQSPPPAQPASTPSGTPPSTHPPTP